MLGNNNLVDSGERVEYRTGGIREPSTGKGRYDLISPISLKRLAIHFENGAQKYHVRNWENGLPMHRYFTSAVSHLYEWLNCKLLKMEQQEDHLAAAAWNVLCLLHTEVMVESGNLPKYFDDIRDGLKDS